MKHLFDYGPTATPAEIERMIEYGAKVDCINEHGRTPFMTAVLLGYAACASTLHKLGANINHQDPQGNTSLILACYAGMATSVSFLLNLGADPGILDKDGNDALAAVDMNPGLSVADVDKIKGLLAAHGIQKTNALAYITAIRIPSMIHGS